MKHFMVLIVVLSAVMSLACVHEKDDAEFIFEQNIGYQDFSSIELLGYIDLFYVQSGEPSVIIKTKKEEHFDEIKFSFKNNKLIVENADRNRKTSKSMVSIKKSDNVTINTNSKKIQVFVTAPRIESVEHAGAGRIIFADNIDLEKLDFEIAGAVSININNISVSSLSIEIAGASNATVSGQADVVRFESAGAGKIDAINLNTLKADIEISGAGTISIHCLDELSVEIAGVGRVNYKGNPKIKQSVSGLGRLNKID